jgi:hypothetical protein
MFLSKLTNKFIHKIMIRFFVHSTLKSHTYYLLFVSYFILTHILFSALIPVHDEIILSRFPNDTSMTFQTPHTIERKALSMLRRHFFIWCKNVIYVSKWYIQFLSHRLKYSCTIQLNCACLSLSMKLYHL